MILCLSHAWLRRILTWKHWHRSIQFLFERRICSIDKVNFFPLICNCGFGIWLIFDAVLRYSRATMYGIAVSVPPLRPPLESCGVRLTWFDCKQLIPFGVFNRPRPPRPSRLAAKLVTQRKEINSLQSYRTFNNRLHNQASWPHFVLSVCKDFKYSYRRSYRRFLERNITVKPEANSVVNLLESSIVMQVQ